MKKTNFLLICCFLFTIGLQAQNQDGQEVKPTEKITTAFEKKYLGEKLLFGWRKVNNLYIITFQHKAVYKYCSFDANGIWKEAGESVEKEKIPAAIYEALPEMDLTAFLVESFTINTYGDTNGYMLLYETEADRIEYIVSDEGKIIRQNQYPIPKKKEEEEEKEDTNEVKWDDGK